MLRQHRLQLLRQSVIQQRRLRQRRQHRACAHRGQLVFIAEQHHAAAARHRTQQVQQQRNVQHRRFVHHQNIQRQRLFGIKLRQHLRRTQFQQTVHRLPLLLQ